MIDEERCFRAILSRDPRFDGWFFTAVLTTGIYCRPSCPAMTPKRANVRFFASAAAAQQAGFRACKRCRPDASPGSPEWSYRADVVGRAMRLIADGIVDRHGVGELASRLGYSPRHLTRILTAEVGAGPLAIARAQRAQTARVLLETTPLPITLVAFAAGFRSVRQFNDTVQAVFAAAPTELRRRSSSAKAPVTAGTIALRLPYRNPIAAPQLFGFLAARAVPGVEEGDSTSYRRTIALPNGTAIVELRNAEGHISCTLSLEDLRDLGTAVQRCRRLLDLDADPEAIDGHLGSDPMLQPLVKAHPGLRSPGQIDASEAATRAVLGQQVSVASARAAAARLVQMAGPQLPKPSGNLTHVFPSPGAIAELDPDALPTTRAKGRYLVNLARALAVGKIDLDPGADRDEASVRLLELPGIGPWTAAYIRLRGLGDPDVFMPGDLGVRRALERLGHDPDDAALSGRWRPWRSYALHHLWLGLCTKGGQ